MILISCTPLHESSPESPVRLSALAGNIHRIHLEVSHHGIGINNPRLRIYQPCLFRAAVPLKHELYVTGHCLTVTDLYKRFDGCKIDVVGPSLKRKFLSAVHRA